MSKKLKNAATTLEIQTAKRGGFYSGFRAGMDFMISEAYQNKNLSPDEYGILIEKGGKYIHQMMVANLKSKEPTNE